MEHFHKVAPPILLNFTDKDKAARHTAAPLMAEPSPAVLLTAAPNLEEHLMEHPLLDPNIRKIPLSWMILMTFFQKKTTKEQVKFYLHKLELHTISM